MPLLAIDLAGQTVYRLPVPRGYWVDSFVLSPDRQKLALFQRWQWGEEYGHEPPGPAWEMRVWDLAANQVVIAETSPILRQEGAWSIPFSGLLPPQQDRLLLRNWVDEQYAVLDLSTGEMIDVTALVSGQESLLWCQGGRALVEQEAGQITRIDLQAMSAEPLQGWAEVALCR